jgi:hypothetical protein
MRLCSGIWRTGGGKSGESLSGYTRGVAVTIAHPTRGHDMFYPVNVLGML